MGGTVSRVADGRAESVMLRCLWRISAQPQPLDANRGTGRYRSCRSGTIRNERRWRRSPVWRGSLRCRCTTRTGSGPEPREPADPRAISDTGLRSSSDKASRRCRWGTKRRQSCSRAHWREAARTSCGCDPSSDIRRSSCDDRLQRDPGRPQPAATSASAPRPRTMLRMSLAAPAAASAAIRSRCSAPGDRIGGRPWEPPAT